MLSFLPFQYFPFSQDLQVILQLRFSKSENLEFETKNTILTSNILWILPIMYCVNLTSQTISCRLNHLWYCEHADYIRLYLQVLIPLDSLFLPFFAENASAWNSQMWCQIPIAIYRNIYPRLHVLSILHFSIWPSLPRSTGYNSTTLFKISENIDYEANHNPDDNSALWLICQLNLAGSILSLRLPMVLLKCRFKNSISSCCFHWNPCFIHSMQIILMREIHIHALAKLSQLKHSANQLQRQIERRTAYKLKCQLLDWHWQSTAARSSFARWR